MTPPQESSPTANTADTRLASGVPDALRLEDDELLSISGWARPSVGKTVSTQQSPASDARQESPKIGAAETSFDVRFTPDDEAITTRTQETAQADSSPLPVMRAADALEAIVEQLSGGEEPLARDEDRNCGPIEQTDGARAAPDTSVMSRLAEAEQLLQTLEQQPRETNP